MIEGYMKQEIQVCKKIKRDFSGKITYSDPINTKAKIKESIKLKKDKEGKEVLVDLEISIPKDIDIDVDDKVIYEGKDCLVIVKSNKFDLSGNVMYKKVYTNKKVNY